MSSPTQWLTSHLLSELAQGKSDHAIADQLVLSKRAVESKRLRRIGDEPVVAQLTLAGGSTVDVACARATRQVARSGRVIRSGGCARPRDLRAST